MNSIRSAQLAANSAVRWQRTLLAGGTLLVAWLSGAGCGSDFQWCEDTRTCPLPPGDAGAAGVPDSGGTFAADGDDAMTEGGGASGAGNLGGTDGGGASNGGTSSLAGDGGGTAEPMCGETGSCECTPGQKTCDGDGGYVTCTPSGTWSKHVDCASATPVCSGNGVCDLPPSCHGLPKNCGSNGSDSCCSSPVVPGTGNGTFKRLNDANYPAKVATFRLDAYEITVGRWRKFMAAYTGPDFIALGAGKNPNNAADPGWLQAFKDQLPQAIGQGSGQNATYDSGNDNRPINNITWYEAQAFCIWDGGRLPTEAEWTYAAQGGTEQRVYPWGSVDPGTDTQLAVYNCYLNPGGPCGFVSVAPVGAVPAGNARWGQADMAGNLSEYVLDDWANPIMPPNCDNCAIVSNVTYAVAHGGNFASAGGLKNSERGQSNRSGGIAAPYYGARCARAY